MMNRVVLVGRLTKDPDLRYTPNGVPVATFTLAVNRPFSSQSGEREADFINCVVWRKPAENVANFLKKEALQVWMAEFKPATMKDKMVNVSMLQRYKLKVFSS